MPQSNRSSGSELLSAYTIAIEADWRSWAATTHQTHPDTAAAIDGLLKVVLDEQADLETRWRDAYLCEQLIGQVMPLERLIAEGDRRLFEAKALGMKSADD